MRLLLLERNRYHALMIERAIAERLPGWVLAQFTETHAAAAECRANRYDAILLATEFLTDDAEIEWLATVGSPLIVLGNGQGDFQRLLEIRLSTTVTTLIKDDSLADRLIAALEKLPDSHPPGCPVAHLPQLCSSQQQVVALTSRTIAHEINNPLMAIAGMAELLLDSSELVDPAMRRKVTAIAESAARIRHIISALTSDQPIMRKQTVVGEYLTPASPMRDSVADAIKG